MIMGRMLQNITGKSKAQTYKKEKKSTFRKSCSHDLSRHRVPLVGQPDRMH